MNLISFKGVQVTSGEQQFSELSYYIAWELRKWLVLQKKAYNVITPAKYVQ